MPLLEPEPEKPVRAIAKGWLDRPPGAWVLPREIVRFEGWAQFVDGAAVRVELWLGDEPLGNARLGVPRPDVCAELGVPAGTVTGFELTADITDWPGRGETIVRATATDSEGERLGLGTVPVTVLPAEVPEPEPDPPPSPTPVADRGFGLRTLVYTHQLDLGGAQLYLLDLLRELLRLGAIDPTVVSGKDGELRPLLEEMGIPVHLAGRPPIEELGSYLGRVEELAAWAGGRNFEVAFVNTATALALPGAELATRLEIPAVWAIHESFLPAVLWADLDPAIRCRAEAALGQVSTALFVAEATKELFEPWIEAGRAISIPYGLDLELVDAGRDGFDREAARRRAGIGPDAVVALCVGSIEPRKGQVPLAQAFGLIAENHPLADLVFVGARDDPDSRFLAQCVAASPAAERIRLIPMTSEVQSWFGLANLLVCASDIESTPRSVLEAMAWEIPVLATSIFGLPELIEHGRTGWLCPPRDLGALVESLDLALGTDPAERERIGRAGRALVEERHSLEGYGRAVAQLLEEAVEEADGPALDRPVPLSAST